MRFLVIEIWSILYSTAVNSDLRKIWKIFLRNMPLTQTSEAGVLDDMQGPMTCKDQRHSLSGGCGALKTTHRKKKILFFRMFF